MVVAVVGAVLPSAFACSPSTAAHQAHTNLTGVDVLSLFYPPCAVCCRTFDYKGSIHNNRGMYTLCQEIPLYVTVK